MEFGLVGAALCALFFTAPAGAESVGDGAFKWHMTPACSSASQLKADISRILARTPGRRRHVTSNVTGTQTARGGWTVELVTVIDGARHQRTFEAESCAGVLSAVTLILAIASDPNAVAPSVEQPETRGIDRSEQISDPSPEPAIGNNLPSGTQAERREALSIFAAVALDTGTGPSATEGGALGLGYRRDKLHVELSADAWAARDQSDTAKGSGAGAQFGLWSAALRVGYSLELANLEIGPLLSVELTHVSAHGFGGTGANFCRGEFLSGFGGGGFGELWLSRALSIDLELGAVLWANRPSFVVAQPPPAAASSLYRPSLVAGRAQLGTSIHFF